MQKFECQTRGCGVLCGTEATVVVNMYRKNKIKCPKCRQADWADVTGVQEAVEHSPANTLSGMAVVMNEKNKRKAKSRKKAKGGRSCR